MTKKVTWLLISLFAFQALMGIILPLLPKAQAASKTIEVTVSALNVRSGPSTGYSRIGSISKGARYTVASEKNGWVQINYGSKKGWVHGDYVKVLSSGTTATGTLKVNTAVLNVRSSYSTKSSIIARVTQGQTYNILGSQSGWYKITANGKTGWVHGDYVKVISTSSPTPPATSDKNGVKINASVLNVRSSYSTSSKILTGVTKGQTYLIQGSHSGWYKITANGKTGWVHGGYVTLIAIAQPQPTPQPKPVPKPQPAPAPSKEKVRLAWDFYGSISNVDKPAAQTGYNVVSPVWYYVTGDASNPAGIGINTSKASQAYVDKAHQNGYKVWALFSDIHDKYQPTRTAAIFNNPAKEDEIIKKLVADVVAKNIDGVNIDFEGMGKSSRDKFTGFVQKLTTALKAHNKMVSVDVTGYAVNSAWSECYDRVALGKIVDYVSLMAYDEYWASSPTAGSVGSLGWVENHLKKMVTEVPKEKVLLGMPFYTRDWKISSGKRVEVQTTSLNVRQEATTTSNVIGGASQGSTYTYLGTVEGQNINGTTTWYKIQYGTKVGYVSAYYSAVRDFSSTNSAISSSAIGMGTQDSLISKYKAKVTYDAASGQNLAVYTGDDGYVHKIWMEDELSIGKRADLAVKYDLGGMGAWRLGFEKQGIWPIIQNKVK